MNIDELLTLIDNNKININSVNKAYYCGHKCTITDSNFANLFNVEFNDGYSLYLSSIEDKYVYKKPIIISDDIMDKHFKVIKKYLPAILLTEKQIDKYLDQLDAFQIFKIYTELDENFIKKNFDYFKNFFMFTNRIYSYDFWDWIFKNINLFNIHSIEDIFRRHKINETIIKKYINKFNKNTIDIILKCTSYLSQDLKLQLRLLYKLL